MSKNTSNTATATATAATASSSVAASKRVTKKSDAAPVAAAAAPAPVAAVAAPVASSSKKGGKSQTAEVVAAVAAPVAVAAAPVASSAEVVAEVEVRSIDQEINDLVKLHQNLRDQAVAAIKKRVAKEIKEAGRRRRRVKKEDDGQAKEKRPTIFTTPVTLKDELCAFLGKPKGSQMTPADVTRAFSAYVESHKLKDAEKGHTIHPDAAMRKVLGLKEGDELGYRTIQTHLYKLYILPEKKGASKQ